MGASCRSWRAIYVVHRARDAHDAVGHQPARRGTGAVRGRRYPRARGHGTRRASLLTYRKYPSDEMSRTMMVRVSSAIWWQYARAVCPARGGPLMRSGDPSHTSVRARVPKADSALNDIALLSDSG